MARFNVVVPKIDGGADLYPMKEWLRRHPEILPGVDPSIETSHQLRNRLRRLSWSVHETPDEVRLVPPGTADSAVEAILGENEELNGGDAEAADAYFALEYQLRDFLASNLATTDVQGKKLRLYADPATGRNGIEFPTAVGPIDILAVDEAGAFYVFELKRARSPDHAIGQLSRYMGWVCQTIGKDRRVRRHCRT
jgi:endonuclease